MKNAQLNMKDFLGNPANRTIGLDGSATAKDFSDLLNAYKDVTAMGLEGSKATESLPDLLPDNTFTASAAKAGSRRWREGRLIVGLAPHSDGAGQRTGFLNIPGIDESFISGNSIVDSGGKIAKLLGQLGMDSVDGNGDPVAGGKGRLSNGQKVTGLIRGYVHNKDHNGDEDIPQGGDVVTP